MATRSILHFRLDSLGARIEQIRNPEIREKPVVVGKSSGNMGAVVVSASPEARTFGVSEGQSVRHAQRLCPDGVFLSANFALYKEYAYRAFDILAEYSPLVEPQSIDRVFVDVTASRNLFGRTKRMAVEAALKIRERMGLEIAVGVAANKFVSESAASSAAPGEVRLVRPGLEGEFLSMLPVRFIWGVGEKTERRLADLRVHTIGQLATIPERMLIRQFGQIGSSFHRLSQGVDFSPVLPAYPFEIIKTEQMFESELEEPDQVREHLPQMADRLALELRKRGRLAEHITLKIMAPQCEISSCRLKRPMGSIVDILAASDRLLGLVMRPGMKVVSLEITLSDLTVGEGIQLSLLGDGEQKQKLDSALETIKDRFGEKSIFYAAALSASGRATVLSRVAA